MKYYEECKRSVPKTLISNSKVKIKKILKRPGLIFHKTRPSEQVSSSHFIIQLYHSHTWCGI